MKKKQLYILLVAATVAILSVVFALIFVLNQNLNSSLAVIFIVLLLLDTAFLGGWVFMKLKFDLSRKALSEQLEKANQANKATNGILYNLARDIRVPLDSIKGYTLIAKKNLGDGVKTSESLDKIDVSANYLQNLLDDVTKVNKIELGIANVKLEPVNLQKFAQDFMVIGQSLATEKHVNFERKINILDENVYTDASHLNQVLLNVMGNAINFSDNNGTIIFTINQRKFTSKNFGSYDFVIESDGKAMSDEFISHIFDSYTQERETLEQGVTDVALGMMVAGRTAEMLGGSLNVDKLEAGTKVTLSINFKFSEKESAESVQKTTADINGLNVMLVEDNHLNREITRELLSEKGANIIEAVDGLDALRLLAKPNQAKIDIILMDIQMPGMNGYEAAQEIRSLKNPQISSLPIIALTANAFEQDRTKAIKSGMNEHVSKPINVDQLCSVISKYTKK